MKKKKGNAYRDREQVERFSTMACRGPPILVRKAINISANQRVEGALRKSVPFIPRHNFSTMYRLFPPLSRSLVTPLACVRIDTYNPWIPYGLRAASMIYSDRKHAARIIRNIVRDRGTSIKPVIAPCTLLISFVQFNSWGTFSTCCEL